MTSSQRLVAHAEENAKLWNVADNSSTSDNNGLVSNNQPAFFSLSRPDVVAINKEEMKPALKVLARKPRNAAGEIIDDDAFDDGLTKKNTVEERARLVAEGIERRKKEYEEARKRIFGENAGDSKQMESSDQSQKSRDGRTGPTGGGGGNKRGVGAMGGAGMMRSGSRNGSIKTSTPSSSPVVTERKLYNPDAVLTPRLAPSSRSSSVADTPGLELPIRNPIGPDASGGRGFISRSTQKDP